MAIATDLGYIPPNVKQALREVDVLLLESNHDLEMLKDGPYPWSVKQRVLSRVGHLSNTAAAEFLERDYDGAEQPSGTGAAGRGAGHRSADESAGQSNSTGHAGDAVGADLPLSHGFSRYFFCDPQSSTIV